MKYMLLLWGDEKPWAEAGPEERERLYAEHGRFGELLARSCCRAETNYWRPRAQENDLVPVSALHSSLG